MLFEQTTKKFHLPSAEAKGAEKVKLLKEAAAGYERLLREYPEQESWAAQGLRNLAGVKAAQGKVDQAVRVYGLVETRYPKQEQDILMAWKAAGDLLWEEKRKEEAKKYYEKIVSRFDKVEAGQMVKLVVRGSKQRLAGNDLPEEKKP